MLDALAVVWLLILSGPEMLADTGRMDLTKLMHKFVFRRLYSRSSFIGIAMLVVLGLLAHTAAPAEASKVLADQAQRADGMSNSIEKLEGLGVLRVAAAADDVVISLDITVDYTRNELLKAITETQTANAHLSDTIRTQMQAYRVDVPNAGTDSWETFDGTLAATDAGLQVTISGGEARIESTWWTNVLATVVGVMVAIGTRAICLGTLLITNPGAGLLVPVLCASIGAFLGSMTRSVILMVVDGKTADAEAWGQALLTAIAVGVGAAAWEAGVNVWAKETLPGLLQGWGQSVKELAGRLPGWLASLRGALVSVGDKMREMAGYLPSLVVSPPSGGQKLKVMPLGDSITAGLGSSNGTAYRGPLYQRLAGNVDFVGSRTDGGDMPDPDNEGHSGWRIDQIADNTTAWSSRYRPDAVTLHLGTNDMDQNYQVGTAPDRLGGVIDRILGAQPGATVLVSSIVPSTKPETQSRIVQFNGRVSGMVEQRRNSGEHVLFVNMGGVTTADLADALHPNDQGYQRMANAFYDGIQQAARNGWIPDPGVGNPAPEIRPGTSPQPPPPPSTGSATTPGVNSQVRFADFDGDGRDDYLVVDPDGSIRAWINKGGDTASGPGWDGIGRVAKGVGVPGDRVRLADMNNDGQVDYLAIRDNGSVDWWLNQGGDTFLGPDVPFNGWYGGGPIAAGVGAPAGQVRFADFDGDGHADYIVVGDDGSLDVWIFEGGGLSGGWDHRVPKVASGVGIPGSQVRLADVNNDKKVDYLAVASNGSVRVWLNNGGDTATNAGWGYIEKYAAGVGAPAGQVYSADMNADGRADYLVVGPGGSVREWEKTDDDWAYKGQIASGVPGVA